MLKKMALKLLFRKLKKGGMRVVFWDGDQEVYGCEPPSFTVRFNREPPLSFNVDDVVLLFGEAYADGIIDFEGTIDDVIHVLALNDLLILNSDERLIDPHYTDSPDLAEQKENIHHHYDLGNEFFALWLDKTMSYSCAFFENPEDTLEQAQLQKIDHILKKLDLHEGEKLLDIGCGWGWLIIQAAQQYRVHSTGITLSDEQYAGVKQRIKRLGLEKLVDVQLVNYQELDPERQKFDKIVSVGMFEHVGQGNLPQYMNKINELLIPGGTSLLHTITVMFENMGNSWMGKYIFPGGYVPSLREIVHLLPEYDFHLTHSESLRLHYAKTLDCWHERFFDHIDEIRNKYGERFVRIWSLYLQGCAAAFRSSGLDVYQLLFTKGLNNLLPLTYRRLYSSESH